MRDSINVLDFINTAKSARELLAYRVSRVNLSGKYANSICCGSGSYVESLRQSGHRVHVVDQPRNMAPLEIFQSIFRFRKILTGEQIQILHTHGSLVGAIGRIAAKLSRTPIVVHQVHGFHHHQNMTSIVRWASIFTERIAARWTDALLFQNIKDMEECTKLSIAPSDKLYFVGNGINLQEFNSSPAPNNNAPVLLCVARFEPVKNHQMLLDAVKILKEMGIPFHLNLVGEGPTRATCEDWVKQNSLTEAVSFLGYRDDVPRLTAETDICVLVSLKEGIPRAIMEAGASGRPVVATNVSGNREAVLEGKTGFLVPLDNARALAMRLELLINNRELREELGRNAFDHALANFNEEQVTDRIMEVYENFVTRKLQPQTGHQN